MASLANMANGPMQCGSPVAILAREVIKFPREGETTLLTGTPLHNQVGSPGQPQAVPGFHATLT